MKNKLKPVRRGSNSAASPQSKSQQGKASARSPKIVICVWILSDGSEWARVGFPREVFSRIERAASKLKINLEEFFDNAIHSYVAAHEAKGGA
jgi:hypothetical protein